MIKKFIASPIDSILNKKSKNAIENKAVAEAIEQIESDIARLEGLKASLSQYGSVKLSAATDVTDSAGLALPVTEKNPSIDGTLANEIEKIENRFLWTHRSNLVSSNVKNDSGQRVITYNIDLSGCKEVCIRIYARAYAPMFYRAFPLIDNSASEDLYVVDSHKFVWSGRISATRSEITVITHSNSTNIDTNYLEANNIWTR